MVPELDVVARQGVVAVQARAILEDRRGTSVTALELAEADPGETLRSAVHVAVVLRRAREQGGVGRADAECPLTVVELEIEQVPIPAAVPRRAEVSRAEDAAITHRPYFDAARRRGEGHAVHVGVHRVLVLVDPRRPRVLRDERATAPSEGNGRGVGRVDVDAIVVETLVSGVRRHWERRPARAAVGGAHQRGHRSGAVRGDCVTYRAIGRAGGHRRARHAHIGGQRARLQRERRRRARFDGAIEQAAGRARRRPVAVEGRDDRRCRSLGEAADPAGRQPGGGIPVVARDVGRIRGDRREGDATRPANDHGADAAQDQHRVEAPHPPRDGDRRRVGVLDPAENRFQRQQPQRRAGAAGAGGETRRRRVGQRAHRGDLGVRPRPRERLGGERVPLRDGIEGGVDEPHAARVRADQDCRAVRHDRVGVAGVPDLALVVTLNRRVVRLRPAQGCRRSESQGRPCDVERKVQRGELGQACARRGADRLTSASLPGIASRLRLRHDGPPTTRPAGEPSDGEECHAPGKFSMAPLRRCRR